MARLFARGRWPIIAVTRSRANRSVNYRETLALCSDGSVLAYDTLSTRWRLVGARLTMNSRTACRWRDDYLANGWSETAPWALNSLEAKK